MADFGIMSWTPGQDHDAGSESTMSPTTDGAVAANTAYWQEQESDTLHTGTVLGDKMVIPSGPDEDTSLLMPLPGVPIGTSGQGGSYDGAYNPAGSSLMGNGLSGSDTGTNMGGRS